MANTIISKNTLERINKSLSSYFEYSVSVKFQLALDRYDSASIGSKLMKFHDKLVELNPSKEMHQVDDDFMGMACECFKSIETLQKNEDFQRELSYPETSDFSTGAKAVLFASRPVYQSLKAITEKYTQPSLSRGTEETT